MWCLVRSTHTKSSSWKSNQDFQLEPHVQHNLTGYEDFSEYLCFSGGAGKAEIVLQTPGLGDAVGVRTSRESPVSSVVSTTTLAIPEVVRVLVVDPRLIADVTSSPALVGKSQTDSPAAAAFCAPVQWVCWAGLILHP